MATHNITATSRKVEGKGASRRLRHSGQVPAIVYGAQGYAGNHPDRAQPSLARQPERVVLLVDPAALESTARTQKVLLRDMQRHPFKQQILHLDFQRVDENDAIRFNVPLHFLNQEISPAGKTAGIVVTA